MRSQLFTGGDTAPKQWDTDPSVPCVIFTDHNDSNQQAPSAGREQ